MWGGAESNCRHTDFQSVALPTELPPHYFKERQKKTRRKEFQTGSWLVVIVNGLLMSYIVTKHNPFARQLHYINKVYENDNIFMFMIS